MSINSILCSHWQPLLIGCLKAENVYIWRSVVSIFLTPAFCRMSFTFMTFSCYVCCKLHHVWTQLKGNLNNSGDLLVFLHLTKIYIYFSLGTDILFKQRVDGSRKQRSQGCLTPHAKLLLKDKRLAL